MVKLRWCTTHDVDASLHGAWTALGMQAAQPNLYAMPQFVLPASRWLTPTRPARIAVIERIGHGSPELLGVGCFTLHPATLFAPFPHLRGYRTRHTFQDGWLCADGAADDVARALLDAMAGATPRCHAIALRNVAERDPNFLALCARAAHQGRRWYPLRAIDRPVLRRSANTTDLDRISRRVVKDIHRRRRRLQTLGELSTQLIHGEDITAATIDRHLDIEHMGWKGVAGSSMRSSAAETNFFHDMTKRFRKIGGAVFVETRIDGKAIASASLFRAGGTLNAFKTGHDPAFASDSPGRSNVLGLIESMQAQLPGVDMLDSNAQPDSFMASILPDRMTMLSGFLPTTGLGSRALAAARLIRPLAYRLDHDP